MLKKNDMDTERWRDVWVPSDARYSMYYMVSDHGRVRTKERVVQRFSERHGGLVNQVRKPKFLSLRPITKQHRHHRVALKLPDGTNTSIGVHVLVALAFKRRGYKEGLVVRHNDDDGGNNHYTNLKWGTQYDNMQDRQNRNRQAKGSTNGQSVLDEKKVLKIKRALARGVPNMFLAERFGVDRSTVSRIRTGKDWKHVGV